MRSSVVPQAEPSVVSERHERVMGLIRYLLRVASQGAISPTVAMHAWSVWEWLDAATGHQLSVPDAGPGADGQLLYVWEKGDHYMDVEVLPDGHVELYYRNGASGRMWDGDVRPGEPLQAEARGYLGFFASGGDR